jgi:arsenate reductase-like glutaredoxin family protein
MTCGKVSRFLDAHGMEAKQVVPASRKLGKKDARALIESSSRVIVAKGKKVQEFSGGKPTAEAVAALLGPTGNLRSPTLRVGKTLLVGFDESSFEEILGK